MSEEEIVVPDVEIDPLAEDSSLEPSAAPEGEAGKPSTPEVDTAAQDAVQKRINTITAEKYAEKREKEELQRQLDELKGQVKPVETKVGSLEDFDYDEEARNAALISQQVGQKVQEVFQSQQATATQDAKAQESQGLLDNFVTKATEFAVKNPDYSEAVNNLPIFHDDTADAIYSMDNGPQVAHYLGKHLDTADEIANLSPVMAAARLGQISQVLITNNKTVSTSDAPAPVETIGSGGSMTKSIENQSMEEMWSSK